MEKQDGTHESECTHALENKCPNIVRHSCRRHSGRTLLWDTLVQRSCGALLRDTLVEHSCKILQDTLVENCSRRSRAIRFCNTLPRRPTRLSKTNVSHETSSKSHASSLQNKPFVRDFLQSHMSSLQDEHFVRDSRNKTFCSPAKRFHSPSPSKPQLLTRQSLCHSDIHLHQTSQPHGPHDSTPPTGKSDDMTCSITLMSSAKLSLHHTTRLE